MLEIDKLEAVTSRATGALSTAKGECFMEAIRRASESAVRGGLVTSVKKAKGALIRHGLGRFIDG